MKMKRRRQSLRELERHINPCAQIVGLLEIARAGLVAAGPGAERGSVELDRPRRATASLMRTVQGLNEAAFWPSVTVPRANRSQTAEMLQDERSELLHVAREHLVGSDVTRAEIVGAIDTLHEVVTAMNNMFTVGKIKGQDEPEESWMMDRYTCAALLPLLEERLRHFWLQLHGGAAKSDSGR